MCASKDQKGRRIALLGMSARTEARRPAIFQLLLFIRAKSHAGLLLCASSVPSVPQW
jgi:hypothetical protein